MPFACLMCFCFNAPPPPPHFCVSISLMSSSSFSFCLPLLWRCLASAWLLPSDFFSLGGVCQSWVCENQNKQNSVVQWFWHITDPLIVCVCVCLLEGFSLAGSWNYWVWRWLLGTFNHPMCFQNNSLHTPTCLTKLCQQTCTTFRMMYGLRQEVYVFSLALFFT